MPRFFRRKGGYGMQQQFVMPKAMLQNAALSGKSSDVLTQPLYDRINIATTIPTGEQSFFANQQGVSVTIIRGATAAAYNKTLRDTNLEVGGQVKKAFTVAGISLDYCPVTYAAGSRPSALIAQDIMTLKFGSWFKFTVLDKTILTGPCAMLPAMNPLSFATTQNDMTMLSGTADSQGGIIMYKLPVPVTIEPDNAFKVVWMFDPPSTAVALNTTMDLLITLHAIMARPN